MELNNIESTGTWGDKASKINDNFSKTNAEVIQLQGIANGGGKLFVSTTALATAYPTPAVGMYAYVSATLSFPAEIYIYNGTTWIDTGHTGNGGDSVENINAALSSALNQISATGVNELNIDKLYPLNSGYYTLSTAIAAVATELKAINAKITFKSAVNTVETWGFISTIDGWSNTSNWQPFGSVEQIRSQKTGTTPSSKLFDDEINIENQNTGVSEYETFSASTSYSIGKVVSNNGILYKFITDHPAGAWNISQVITWSINKDKNYKDDQIGTSFGKMVPTQIAVYQNKHKSYYSCTLNESAENTRWIDGNIVLGDAAGVKIADPDYNYVLRANVLSGFGYDSVFKIEYDTATANNIYIIFALRFFDDTDTVPFEVNFINSPGGFRRYNLKTNAISFENSFDAVNKIELLNSFGRVRLFKVSITDTAQLANLRVNVQMTDTSYTLSQPYYDCVMLSASHDNITKNDRFITYPELYNSNWIDKNLFVVGDSNTPFKFFGYAKAYLGSNVHGNYEGGFRMCRDSYYNDESHWLYEHSRQLFTKNMVKTSGLSMSAYLFFVSYNDDAGGGTLTDATVQAVLDNYPNMSDAVSSDTSTDYYKKLHGGTLSNGTAVAGFNNLTAAQKISIFGYKQTMAAYIRQIYSLYTTVDTPYVFLTTMLYSDAASTDAGQSEERLKRQSINYDINEISEWFGGIPIIDLNKSSGYAFNIQSLHATDIHFDDTIKNRIGKAVCAALNSYATTGGKAVLAQEIGDNAKIAMSQAATKKELINVMNASSSNFYYGIQYDTAVAAPACTRIGNMALHATLPIQSRMRKCLLKDNGTVNYYLDANNSTLKEDGTPALLDGTDGQIMVEIPRHYRKFGSEGTKRRSLISEYPLAGFTEIPLCYISAVEATVDRTNNKLASVVNITAQYRGGGNQKAWDALSKSVLGRPVTDVSLTTFRTYARNRGSVNWNCNTYQIQRKLFWLFAIEYATLNSQAAYNAALTVEGYKQGGLSDGVTTLDSTKWSNFNGYYPFVPCGYTNSLGNKTGVVSFTMPFEYDSNGSANYIGEYNAATAYVAGNYVSSGTSLYVCILASTGNAVTNTTYFTPVTRKTVNVPSYRGVENPFGHVWKWTDGCKCMIQSDASGGISEFYVCDTPANFTSSGTTNYQLRGNLPRVEGYVKEVILGEYGEIMPLSVGGSSTTYFCDYFYTSKPASGIDERGVLFGGGAYYGASAGFVSAATHAKASDVYANMGSRLCFIPN